MSLKKQSGFLTLVAVVLIVVIGFIGIALAWMTFSSTFSISNLQASEEALFLAESGLEQATHKIFTPNLTNRISCASLSTPITNAIGDGSYSTTLTVPPAWPFTAGISNPLYVTSPTTLNGALTAVSTTTTITVASTANYQPFGRIMIDRELINYTSTDATHFYGIERAVDGSALAAHANGTTIGQFQCNLTSQGGSPTLTPSNPGDPGGKRILSENLQLQEAWTVGTAQTTGPVASRGPNIGKYRETAWSYQTTTLATANINSISMVSYAYGWAVGDNSGGENLMVWNGSSWTRQPISALPNTNLYGVYCVANNQCYAVGAVNAGNPVIFNWTGGPNWTQIILGGTTYAVDLRAVHCGASNDCWAVGLNSSPNVAFYKWNGATWTGTNVTVAPSSVGNFDYYSVFCTSTTNCWAAGQSGHFAQYDGTKWIGLNATVAPSNLPSVIYRSVFCNSASDCWVAGDASGGAVIGHYDGTKWTRDTTATAGISAVNLNGISCANASDCWVVGNTTGGQPRVAHYDGTNWANVSVSGFKNQPLLSIDIIAPKSEPFSSWEENFS